MPASSQWIPHWATWYCKVVPWLSDTRPIVGTILFEMGFEGPKWSDTRPIGLMIILDKYGAE